MHRNHITSICLYIQGNSRSDYIYSIEGKESKLKIFEGGWYMYK